jgi:hypothetical protein
MRQHIPEKDESNFKCYHNSLMECARNSVQNFALRGGNTDKTWKELSSEDQLVIMIDVIDSTTKIHEELAFLRDCQGLWAIKNIPQPKWSSKHQIFARFGGR